MKNPIVFILLCLYLIIPQLLKAQDKPQPKAKEDIKLYYRSTISGGIYMHSHGYGVNFRYGQYTSAKTQTILSAELLNMKHSKEYKSFNSYIDDAKGYYYGKQNSLTILRALFMQQKVINGKELKNGVAVSYIYAIGPSFGFLKPIYLDVAYSDGNPVPVAPETTDMYVQTEVFDPDKHDPSTIYGRAPFTRGLGEMSMLFGGHAKFAFNFEYAPEDNMLKAMEVGANLDFFNRKAPIMATEDNSQFFFTLYVSIQFGKKQL